MVLSFDEIRCIGTLPIVTSEVIRTVSSAFTRSYFLFLFIFIHISGSMVYIGSIELRSIIWSDLYLNILILFFGVVEMKAFLLASLYMISCANQMGPAPALFKAEVPWRARRQSLSEKERVLKTVMG